MDVAEEIEKKTLVLDCVASKVPLRFDYIANFDHSDRARASLLSAAKEYLEENVWMWGDDFVIQLPPPLRASQLRIKPSDLFEPPTDFKNELDMLAFDGNDNTVRLNREQLESIRKNAEFEVPSRTFPGEVHKWRLSRLLQLGWARRSRSLWHALSWALKMFIVYAKDRLVGMNHIFSLPNTVKAWFKAPRCLVDLLLGYPALEHVTLDEFIKAERAKYQISELSILESDRQPVIHFLELLQKASQIGQWHNPEKANDFAKAQALRKDFAQITRPPAFRFSVKNSELIVDLRLHFEDIYSMLLPKIDHILRETTEEAQKSWFIPLRNKLIEEAEASEKDEFKLELLINKQIREDYLERFYEKVLANDEKLGGNGIARLVVDQFRYWEFVDDYLTKIDREIACELEEFENNLRSTYPIRSLIGRWMRRQLRWKNEQICERNKDRLYTELIDCLQAKGLPQHAYFLQRDFDFRKQIEPDLRADLVTLANAERTFTWRRKIWLPQNFNVFRVDNKTGNRTQINPIEISYQPRNPPAISIHDDALPFRFVLEHTVSYSNTTSYWGWRWVNFFKRTYLWTVNIMCVCLVQVLFGSGFGLRALFSPSKFYAHYIIDEKTASVFPNAQETTSTFLSRIASLWHHVMLSRVRFEETPDRGFLGKAATRPLNWFWNIIIKGVIGTMILCVLLPATFLIVSVLSLAIGIAAPLWVPLCALLYHLICTTIYDFDSPHRSKFHRGKLFPIFDLIFYRCLLQGILQPVAAIVLAFVIFPITSVLITLLAYARFGLRSLWDTAMFHVIIKRRGRIPANDTFVARRIAGPGLSKDFYYQVNPAVVLATMELAIEKQEMSEYVSWMRHHIDSPLVESQTLLRNEMLGPLGISCSASAESYNILKNQNQKLHEKLAALLNERAQHSGEWINESSVSFHRIRLSGHDLKWAIDESAKMLSEHYPDHVMKWKQKPEATFWNERGLTYRDWNGLAKMLIAQEFGTDFLTPLEEHDKRFELKVRHNGARDYMDQLLSGSHREDLDDVTPTTVFDF
uniref:Uncharacterized protein n=1 Tax=Plectus sambesii TaxID=2011161 RepID=A0A914WQA2_9BILA